MATSLTWDSLLYQPLIILHLCIAFLQREWQSQIFLSNYNIPMHYFLTVYLFKHEVVIIKGICINLFQFYFSLQHFVGIWFIRQQWWPNVSHKKAFAKKKKSFCFSIQLNQVHNYTWKQLYITWYPSDISALTFKFIDWCKGLLLLPSHFSRVSLCATP